MTVLVPAPNGYPIKLVYDKTPAILNGSGEPGGLFYRQVDEATRREYLRLKLGEEVTEYLLSQGADELADVLAVIEALAEVHGTSLDELQEKVERERGGLNEGWMMYGHHPEFDCEDVADGQSPGQRTLSEEAEAGTPRPDGKSPSETDIEA